MPVITISRQKGSMGTEIAQAVAKELNYEYIDKTKICEALSDHGLQPPEIETFDEKKPPFWDYMSIQRNKCLNILRAVLFDFARKDDFVIVGRGGQILLKDFPGAFHIRIIAPFDIRIQRILGRGAKDEKEAVAVLRRSDRDSAGFIRGYFDMDWEDSNLYDLIINTRNLPVNKAAQMIVEFNRLLEVKTGGRRSQRQIADLALVQKLDALLAVILGKGLQDIKISVVQGVVILEGMVNSQVLKEDCQRAAASIKGVTRVENRLSVGGYFGHAEAIYDKSKYRGKDVING